MRKTWVIASREYLAAVRTRSFLISLVCMPLLMLGGVGVQLTLDGMANNQVKRIAVVDRTPGQKLVTAIEMAPERADSLGSSRTVYLIERVAPSAATPSAIRAQRFELSQRVRAGALAGFLDIGTDVITLSPSSTVDARSIRYQSNSPAQDVFAHWAERVVNAALVAERCQQAGLSHPTSAELARHVPLQVQGLLRQNETTGAIEETSAEARVALFILPASLAALMFLVVLVAVTPLMQGVIEEKTQGIAEVLLSSVGPFQLMSGKLLGMVGVSLTLATVYLGGAFTALARYGFTDYLPMRLLIWFIVFQVLAVLMYGSLFIAIGAACTTAKESQTLVIPVVMLITFPMFSLQHVMQEPNDALAMWLSLFPFATPMLMVTRLGLAQEIPWWQPILGVVAMLAAVVLCIYVSGRIFRVGILMQGKGVSFRDLARWLLRG